MKSNKSLVGLYATVCLVCGVLFFILLTLRVFEIFMIPWLWVFAPIWILLCLTWIGLFVAFAFIIVTNKLRERKKYIQGRPKP